MKSFWVAFLSVTTVTSSSRVLAENSSDPFNITDSLALTIGEILHQFRSVTNYVTYIELDLEKEKLNLTKPTYNYTRFDEAWITQFTPENGQDQLKAISCDFSNNLDIRIPIIRNNVTFQEQLNLIKEPEKFQNYSVNFEHARASCTIKSHSNVEVEVEIPSDDAINQINHLPLNTAYLDLVIEEIRNRFIEIIVPSLESIIREKIINNTMVQYTAAHLLDTCSEPNKKLLQKHPNFDSQQQQYYVTLQDFTTHKDIVKIRGLTNFHLIMMSGLAQPNTSNTFTLVMKNVQFEIRRLHVSRIPNIEPTQLLKFQCDYIYITGSVIFDEYDHNGVPKVHVQFPSSITEENFNETLSKDQWRNSIGQLLERYVEEAYKSCTYMKD